VLCGICTDTKREETKGVLGFRAKVFVAVGVQEATETCEAKRWNQNAPHHHHRREGECESGLPNSGSRIWLFSNLWPRLLLQFLQLRKAPMW